MTNLVTGDDYNLSFGYTAGELSTVTGTTDSEFGTSTSTRTYTYASGTHQATSITGTDTLPVDIGTISGIADGASNTVPTQGSVTYDAAGRATSWAPDSADSLLGGLALDLPDTSLNNPETYTYDPEGRVDTATTTTVIAGLIGLTATSTTYAYDAAGDRIAYHAQTGDGTADGYTVTLPGIPGGPVATLEVDSGGGILQAVLDGDRAVRTLATPDGTPLGVQSGSQVLHSVLGTTLTTNTPGTWAWQTADAQDSIRFTDATPGTDADGSGAQFTWSSYYPFGQTAVPVTASTALGTSLDTGTGTNDVVADGTGLPAGRTYLDKQIQPDNSLGLDHRGYQANLDLLTTPDPQLDTSDPLGISPYAYARNNPIASADPTGLYPVDNQGNQLPYNRPYQTTPDSTDTTDPATDPADDNDTTDLEVDLIYGDLESKFIPSSNPVGIVNQEVKDQNDPDALQDLRSTVIRTVALECQTPECAEIDQLAKDINQLPGQTQDIGEELADEIKTLDIVPKGGVYTLRESGNVVRTGRTNNFDARRVALGRDPVLGKYDFTPEFETDLYSAQRGLEQMLYDAYPEAQAANGGYNKIRGVSPTNPKAEDYMLAAQDYLDGLGGE